MKAVKIAMVGAALVWSATAYAAGDPVKGEKVFKQCKICHQVGPNAKPGIGPVQNNVVGSKAASRPGFNYSEAMKNSGLTWDEATLDKYLENPRGVVPGTKMVFVGLKNPQDRADVIAYLATQHGQ
ncbi:cytochrome c family protein [Rhodomicrobium sp. Az07]|uniref:c-type cytochrome n=1 Tax=Rhodomicrobium sp. Az07 TaxID=2839034 RepID=UPI001BE96598|nr:cytochrome c family protein [Rhodomicrobium sp. Az07]MBT3070338.1 cytochrome c family protein [Rhodomicrobium sp. Az07]